jgi:hypothetical protein
MNTSQNDVAELVTATGVESEGNMLHVSLSGLLAKTIK